MFQKRKLILALTALCMLLSIPSAFAEKDRIAGFQSNEKYLESIPIEELENRKDIQKFLSDNGYDAKVQEFISQHKDVVNSLSEAQKSANRTATMPDEKTIEYITEKYGLEKPEIPTVKSEGFLLIERNP